MAAKKPRYGCLVDHGGGSRRFEDIGRVTEYEAREVGTHDEAAYIAGTFARGATVVRVLEDGEHEAAIAAAVKAERARIYKLIDEADDDDPDVSEGLKHALLLIRQNGGSS